MIAAASRVPPSSGKLSVAASTTIPDIVRKVSASCAGAYSARVLALSSASGLPTNSGPLTSQSSAFFITPDTPCAYSGLQISSPSAAATASQIGRATRGERVGQYVE